MPIFVYAAQGVLTAGQIGPLEVVFRGWRVFVETAGLCVYVDVYACMHDDLCVCVCVCVCV